jgi:hypothetical protein
VVTGIKEERRRGGSKSEREGREGEREGMVATERKSWYYQGAERREERSIEVDEIKWVRNKNNW